MLKEKLVLFLFWGNIAIVTVKLKQEIFKYILELRIEANFWRNDRFIP